MADRTIKRMHSEDLKNLYKETIDDINKIKVALSYIDEQKKQASSANLEISGNESTQGILDKVRKILEEAEKKIAIIGDIYGQLYGTDETDSGIKGELDGLLKDFNEAQGKIKSAEKELNGYEEKTQEGEERHIDGLTEKIKKFFEIQKTKYSETFDKIENELLAGATTVGLSKAYTDKADSFKVTNGFWLAGFFLSVVLIVSVLCKSLSDIHGLFFPQILATPEIALSSENLLRYLIVKAVINIGLISSLIWVANFTSKRYSQNKRLAEEYSYKATFAKSFEGYRKRAEELDQLNDNQELSEKLMQKMIEMSSFNPVETMESKSHKESHPTMKMFEKSMRTIEKALNIAINKNEK